MAKDSKMRAVVERPPRPGYSDAGYIVVANHERGVSVVRPAFDSNQGHLTPTEARELASHIEAAADAVESWWTRRNAETAR